jgi:hypothetical protein
MHSQFPQGTLPSQFVNPLANAFANQRMRGNNGEYLFVDRSGTGSSYNYGGYASSQADALIRQANQDQDHSQALTLYQQAEQQIVDDAACLPFTFGGNFLLVQPVGQDLKVNGLGSRRAGLVLSPKIMHIVDCDTLKARRELRPIPFLRGRVNPDVDGGSKVWIFLYLICCCF